MRACCSEGRGPLTYALAEMQWQVEEGARTAGTAYREARHPAVGWESPFGFLCLALSWKQEPKIREAVSYKACAGLLRQLPQGPLLGLRNWWLAVVV